MKKKKFRNVSTSILASNKINFEYLKQPQVNEKNVIHSMYLIKRTTHLENCFLIQCLANKNLNSNYFFNFSFDKSRLKNFVWWFMKKYGQKKTIQLLEELKDVGFGYATLGGISLGIDDLKIPPQKKDLLFQADVEIDKSLLHYKRGEITGVERFQQLINTWHQTSETLKQEVIKYFEITDVLNPVYMMAFSGARGNISQVRQLVGMRGLMADPQGQIIDFPIRSNFREGLTLTEYIISTYGARKGIVDTALRTATAGYLTRRLVDVAQHVIVSQFDCQTKRGIFLFDMKDGIKTLYSFKDRLIGRVLAQDIFDFEEQKTFINQNSKEVEKVNLQEKQTTFKKIGFRNQEISADLATSIVKITKKALVRSPLTCETHKLVCQLCYGWSLSKGSLVSLGEAVGVIAGQSIGEPGTQLTMRTFHTGGVFSGGITDQIIASSDGYVYYSTPIPGTCIRTPQGEIAFLTKVPGSLLFKKIKKSTLVECDHIPEVYNIPAYTILFARHEQHVSKKQILAQFSSISRQQAIQADAEQVIYSSLEGQVYFSHLDLMEQSHEKYGDITWETDAWAKVWILAGKIYENPVLSYFFPKHGDFVNSNSIVNQIEWFSPNSCFLHIQSLINEQKQDQLMYKYQQNSILNKKTRAEYQIEKKINIKLLQKTCNLDSQNNIHFINQKLVNENSPNLVVLGQSAGALTPGPTGHSADVLASGRSTEFFNKNPGSTNAFASGRSTGMLTPGARYCAPSVFYKQHKVFPKTKQKYNVQITSNRVICQKFLQMYKNILLYQFKKLKVDHLFEFDHKISHVKLKLTNLGPMFYYPFQVISHKRLFNFLNYTSRSRLPTIENLIDSKKIPMKIIDKKNKRKTKLSLLHLQKKWQPWYLRGNVSKIVSKKTIQNKLKNKDNIQKLKKHFIKITSKNDYQKYNVRKKLILKQNNKINLIHYQNLLKPFTIYKQKSFLFNLKCSDFSKIEFNSKNTKWGLKKSVSHSQNIRQLAVTNSNFLLKSPVLFLNVNTIVYKKVGYLLHLNNQDGQFTFKNHKNQQSPILFKTQNSNNYWNQKNNIDFNHKKEMKIFTLIPLNQNFFMKINAVETNKELNNKFSTTHPLKNRILENRYLKTNNTLNWTNFSKHLFSWFPENSQTFNNGIFMISGPLNVDHDLRSNIENLNKKKCGIFSQLNKKPLNKFDSNEIFTIKKINWMTLPLIKCLHNLQLPVYKNYTNKSFTNETVSFLSQEQQISHVDLSKLKKTRIQHNLFYFKTLTQLIKEPNLMPINSLISLKKKKNIFIFSLTHAMQIYANQYKLMLMHPEKGKKNIKIQFEKVKFSRNSLRWNNTKLLKKSQMTTSSALKQTKIQKFSVNFNEIFWLPQQNYELSIWQKNTSKNSLNNWHINFVPTKKPLFFILNKQGTKKPIFSNFEGFLTINYKKQSNNSFLYSQQKMSFNKNNKKNSLVNIGPDSIKNIKLALKMNFLASIFKSKTKLKIRQPFRAIFQQKSESYLKRTYSDSFLISSATSDPSLLVLNPKNILGMVSYSHISLLPIKNITSNFVLNNSKIKMSRSKNLNSNVVQAQISLKQGWMYVINNFSKVDLLHQSFIEPGISFLNDLCFDQHRVFVEILPFVFKKTVIADKILFSTSPFHKKIFSLKNSIYNDNGRFFQKPDASIPSLCSANCCAILIRPLNLKILPSVQVYKIELSKLNSQLLQPNFSWLIFKQFYSGLLNQQKSSVQLISPFPSPDIYIENELKLPTLVNRHYFSNKLITIEKKRNFQYQKLSLIYLMLKKVGTFLKSFSKFSGTELLEFKDTKNLFLNNMKNDLFAISHNHQRGLFKEEMYFSAYPLNFVPLKITGLIPYNKNYPFKLPLVCFNSNNSCTNTTMSQCSNFLTNSVLNFLVLKNLLLTHPNIQIIENYPNLVPSEIHNLQINSNGTNPIKIHNHKNCAFRASLPALQQKQFEHFSIFNSLKFLLSLPHFHFSYAANMNSLYNQRLFQLHFGNNNSNNSTNSLTFYKSNHNTFKTRSKFLNQKIRFDFSHSFPIIKNELLLYNNKILTNQPMGKTSFLSPLEGEIIDKQLHGINKNQHLWNASSGIEYFQKKCHLILTKSDLVTIYLSSLDLIKKYQALNRFQYHGTNTKNLPTKQQLFASLYCKMSNVNQYFQKLESEFLQKTKTNNFKLEHFQVKYQNKIYKIKGLDVGLVSGTKKLRLGVFVVPGDPLYSNIGINHSGQIVHLNSYRLTLRYGQCISASPNAILHTYNGEFIQKNTPIMTLPFQTLKTGDIVQGIPKVEQYLEARTTQQGRLFVRSLPVLLRAIYQRYCLILSRDKAVRQSFLKIQQILVDGVQRVYRSQGISIADKHLEVIVKQMTSKVQIIFGGQTGFFPGELVDLDFVEKINKKVLVKVHYEPIVLGITRASLEVDSFLSAASFQQTTKILARAAIYKQKDYLKGLKENLLIGNLLPAGTGYIMYSIHSMTSKS